MIGRTLDPAQSQHRAPFLTQVFLERRRKRKRRERATGGGGVADDPQMLPGVGEHRVALETEATAEAQAGIPEGRDERTEHGAVPVGGPRQEGFGPRDVEIKRTALHADHSVGGTDTGERQVQTGVETSAGEDGPDQAILDFAVHVIGEPRAPGRLTDEAVGPDFARQLPAVVLLSEDQSPLRKSVIEDRVGPRDPDVAVVPEPADAEAAAHRMGTRVGDPADRRAQVFGRAREIIRLHHPFAGGRPTLEAAGGEAIH